MTATRKWMLICRRLANIICNFVAIDLLLILLLNNLLFTAVAAVCKKR